MNKEEITIVNNNEIEEFYKQINDMQQQLEVGEEQYNDLVEEKEELQQQLAEYKEKYLNAVSDYEFEKSKNKNAVEYINEEFKKIKNHQYATGIRRLNKILSILEKENKND